MFINNVENIVGLSKKSIRFYESEGLINPNRDTNGYRIYSDKDVSKLKIIKFLRELNVPIKDLIALDNGTLSLKECMLDRIKKIESEEEDFKKIKVMCENIIKSNEVYESIDITKYFQEIRILNKKGFTMRDVKSNKNNKIIGAIISSIVFSIFFIFLGGMISYFQFTESEKIPWIIYSFLMFIFSVPIISIIYNLIIRIKEINGGEEDEASKY